MTHQSTNHKTGKDHLIRCIRALLTRQKKGRLIGFIRAPTTRQEKVALYAASEHQPQDRKRSSSAHKTKKGRLIVIITAPTTIQEKVAWYAASEHQSQDRKSLHYAEHQSTNQKTGKAGIIWNTTELIAR
jgi:hypothetical protein